MISILRRVRGGGVVSVSRGRSSCPVSLGLEYDGSVAYTIGHSKTTWQCKWLNLVVNFGTLEVMSPDDQIFIGPRSPGPIYVSGSE